MQTNDRRRQQFELERSLRVEILQSSRQERNTIVAAVYDRLFQAFPDHSVFEVSPEQRRIRGRLGAALIAPLLPERARVLEVGCGRGDTLVALSVLGHECIGLEPSLRMVDMSAGRDVAVQFGTADNLDFDDGSFDAVFCQEVLEHLHPDDVPVFFLEAFRVLRPGGVLSIETPNPTTGPQDISRGFTIVAEGLHLKEWPISDLIQEFEVAGFKDIRGLLTPQYLARRWQLAHRMTWVPARVKYVQDLVLKRVPCLALRTFVGKCIGLDDIFLFGRKST